MKASKACVAVAVHRRCWNASCSTRIDGKPTRQKTGSLTCSNKSAPQNKTAAYRPQCKEAATCPSAACIWNSRSRKTCRPAARFDSNSRSRHSNSVTWSKAFPVCSVSCAIRNTTSTGKNSRSSTRATRSTSNHARCLTFLTAPHKSGKAWATPCTIQASVKRQAKGIFLPTMRWRNCLTCLLKEKKPSDSRDTGSRSSTHAICA